MVFHLSSSLWQNITMPKHKQRERWEREREREAELPEHTSAAGAEVRHYS